jgi:formamidopyrimidine-DNA glycosylase
MPELPQMQALSERLDGFLAGTVLDRYEMLGFSALKTAVPPPDDLLGRSVESAGRRGKYLLLNLEDGYRIAIHLSQGGRLDVERPPKATKPRGSVVRLVFVDPDGAAPTPTGILVREYGTQRKAGWWVLAPDDEGPLATLGPEPDSEEFASLVRTDTSNRRLYTWLRDQRTVAGVGRGYTDDALNRAQLSPFAALGGLDAASRERLLDSVRAVMASGLRIERQRQGGLSEAKLGERFTIHNKTGEPCPRCGLPLKRVSFDSYELTYCTCQTDGKELADRRLSRLLR